jgi:hypothetical protein
MKINPHIRKEAVTFSSYDGYAHDNFGIFSFIIVHIWMSPRFLTSVKASEVLTCGVFLIQSLQVRRK